MRFGLVIPTLNAGDSLKSLLVAINNANGISWQRRLVVDSSSTDATPHIAKDCGFEVVSIARSEFDHGGTRQKAVDLMRPDVDVVVFLTQDVAVDNQDCFARLAESFNAEDVGLAYGRQIPHKNASMLAALLREFNYPANSLKKTLNDKERLGLKTAFASDSFAAYRITALDEVGGFPRGVACSEDMYVAAKMLLQGYAVMYNAEAIVRHSHEFDLRSAWNRYRNVGAFHAREKWLGQTFGRAEGEGMKLLKMQLQRAMAMGGVTLAAKIIFDDAIKFLAYRFGYSNG